MKFWIISIIHKNGDAEQNEYDDYFNFCCSLNFLMKNMPDSKIEVFMSEQQSREQ